jgi:hypothetical protein
MSDWEREFGEKHRPPQRVIDLLASGTLEDCSWHNDTCPSFHHKLAPYSDDADEGRVDLRLWVEAENPEYRENSDWQRYGVSDTGDSGETFISTDDIDEALAVLEREAMRIWKLRNPFEGALIDSFPKEG